MRAVIPAAGLATRLYPLTLGVPQELLPVGPRLAIDYVLDEAIDSGVGEVGIVISPRKERLRRYLLESQGQGRFTEISLKFLNQPEPRGLGDAILRAADYVEGKWFALLLPAPAPHSVRAVDQFTSLGAQGQMAPAARRIPPEHPTHGPAAFPTGQPALAQSLHPGQEPLRRRLHLRHPMGFHSQLLFDKRFHARRLLASSFQRGSRRRRLPEGSDALLLSGP